MWVGVGYSEAQIKCVVWRDLWGVLEPKKNGAGNGR